MAFAAGMLRSLPDLDPLRREAGVTSSRAEIARQRLLLQGRSHSAHLDRVHDILIALRAICGATNVVAITRQYAPDACTAARADRYDRLTGALRGTLAGKAMVPFEADEPDDLGRAVQALVTAVQDYAADTSQHTS
jgi:hypothetical protein